MTIAAIPTTYRSIRFRSRLEARWACWMDKAHIDWSYEPVDMPGWIPDFRIRNVLVEVKPVTEFPVEAAAKAIRARPFPRGREEWDRADAVHSVLFLGQGPMRFPALPFARQIGWVIDAGYESSGSFCPVLIWQVGHGGQRGRLIVTCWHEQAGNALLGPVDGLGIDFDGLSPRSGEAIRLKSGEYTDAAWARAGNDVQWKGR